nr:NfeD family protein [Psychrobacillus sp. OK028]
MKGVSDIEQVFLYGLIGIGLITILYVLFADAIDGMDGGIFNPTTILSFLLFICASGFILLKLTDWDEKIIIVAALLISGILTFLLYFFILVPLASAEVSTAYTNESLQGQIGRVIVPIPSDGFGEIVIETVSGVISKRAAGYDKEEIEYDKQVLIIDVEDGTFLVKEYVPLV